MLSAILALGFGLVLLVWSAGRFVEGSACTARHFKIPQLVIGMVIVGFGTSAPEVVVSIIAAVQGNPGLALGNAYGSNITNIALILGTTALISPININSQVLRKELPILAAVTALAAYQIWDGKLTRIDSIVLLSVFSIQMFLTIRHGMRKKTVISIVVEIKEELDVKSMPIKLAVFWLFAGLILLIVSSRILVWGAVKIASGFGVSDLIIGLTIVAVGTSLPELASSIVAIRKGEHDLAIGNILGSNLFNTLVAVGITGCIRPMTVAPEVFSRDILTMSILTASLFVIGFKFRQSSRRINRFEGALLLASYIGYTVYLTTSTFGK